MRCILAALLLALPTVGTCQWVEFPACGLEATNHSPYESFSGPAESINSFFVWAPAITHVTSFTPHVIRGSRVECVVLTVGANGLIVIGSTGDVLKKLRAAKCKRNRTEGK